MALLGAASPAAVPSCTQAMPSARAPATNPCHHARPLRSIFEKETGKTVQTLPLAHQKGVISVSMSADGSTVASVGNDGKV